MVFHAFSVLLQPSLIKVDPSAVLPFKPLHADLAPGNPQALYSAVRFLNHHNGDPTIYVSASTGVGFPQLDSNIT